ncbi:MAG: serine hydrolase [Patescibacteria group bacterium]|nr:serine hydrolase [Patescibacteria group bacterium]
MPLILILILSLNIIYPTANENFNNNLDKQFPKKFVNDSLGISTTAKSVLVVDKESNKILFAKNKNEVLPIASITKLMSVLILLDCEIDWRQEVVIKKEDRREGGRIYLGYGEVVTAKDLLNLALIASDNQAIIALARISNLSNEDFVKSMNVKAKELKMGKTEFFDPAGLNPKNVSTAEDLIKLSVEIFNHDNIVEILSKDKYFFRNINIGRFHQVFSTNRLLNSFLADKGSEYFLNAGKTGHLEEAGYCFFCEAKNNNGNKIFVVILGSETNQSRFQEAKALISWVFTNWEWEKSDA